MNSKRLEVADIKKSLIHFIMKPQLAPVYTAPLNDDDSFMDKGILDSTGVLELVGFIESEFDFRVESDEITPDNLDSINKLTAFIQKKTVSGRA